MRDDQARETRRLERLLDRQATPADIAACRKDYARLRWFGEQVPPADTLERAAALAAWHKADMAFYDAAWDAGDLLHKQHWQLTESAHDLRHLEDRMIRAFPDLYRDPKAAGEALHAKWNYWSLSASARAGVIAGIAARPEGLAAIKGFSLFGRGRAKAGRRELSRIAELYAAEADLQSAREKGRARLERAGEPQFGRDWFSRWKAAEAALAEAPEGAEIDRLHRQALDRRVAEWRGLCAADPVRAWEEARGNMAARPRDARLWRAEARRLAEILLARPETGDALRQRLTATLRPGRPPRNTPKS
jgi:hypothetical protein